jgi:DNA-binding transcriptional ArsR family regulator
VSDKNRIRALMALQKRELCLCQITSLLELAPSTVSKHMSILKQSGLVTSRKQDRWMYYRIPDMEESSFLKRLMDILYISVEADQDILNDKERLKRILVIPKEKLDQIVENYL